MIAIIGMSCRLPGGVKSPAELWGLLKNKTDAITEIPGDRWNKQNFFHTEQAGKTYSRWGGFIEDIDKFDPQFFGISPREAVGMDPQQRILLELAWEAIENSGTVPKNIENTNTGVYVGISSHDYCDLQTAHEAQSTIDAYTQTGNCNSIAANRISYVFNLKGPSLAIDTACSSSLVALDCAVQDLMNNKCEMALAAGIQILLRPEIFIGFSMASMLSPTGRCRSFSSDADGFVRAEGGGILFLKPLEKAIENGDTVHAVICATGTNQDGKTRGMTVPSEESQMKLIVDTCKQAGISPGLVQYFEAHGTGTKVGDPIEANSIGRVVGKNRTSNPCFMGSVKSNIGHLESASGMAGILKTVMALKNKQIPANIHVEKLNSNIPFESLGLAIPTDMIQWPENVDGNPRYAGVNSFGFGGSNGYAVLSEAPSGFIQKKQVYTALSKEKILTFSAHTIPALKNNAQALLAFFETAMKSEDSISDAAEWMENISYSANANRTHHKERIAIVGPSREAWAKGIQHFLDETPHGDYYHSKIEDNKTPLVFVFSGMGQQWFAMTRGLMDVEPVFKMFLKRCDAELAKYVQWSLLEELDKSEDISLINQTDIAQPAIFSLQVSLCELLKSWGIVPDIVVGHSVGEVAAAYVAGALSFDESIKLIYHRSRLQHKTSGQGAMLALGIGEDEVSEYLGDNYEQVSIASINSSKSITLSGQITELKDIAEKAENNGVFARYLKVDVPYHSPAMDPLMDELISELDDIDPMSVKIPLYSTVIGSQITGFEMDGEYWADNMRDPVLFKKVIEEISSEGPVNFIEISAHPVLGNSIREILGKNKQESGIYQTLYRGKENNLQLQSLIAALYCIGKDVNWKSICQNGRLVELPVYQFNRERYWKEPVHLSRKRVQANLKLMVGYKSLNPWPEFHFDINSFSLPWLNHHRIQNEVVFPASGYIEMLFEILEKNETRQTLSICDIEFIRALSIDSKVAQKIKCVLNEDTNSFAFYSESSSDTINWLQHSKGKYEFLKREKSLENLSFESIQKKCSVLLNTESIYSQFDKIGLNYTAEFRGISSIWKMNGESWAEITVDHEKNILEGYLLHPVLLDSAFQSLIACLPSNQNKSLLPVFIEKVSLYPQSIEGKLYCYGKIVSASPKGYTGDLILFNKRKDIVAEVTGLRLQKLENQSLETVTDEIDSYEYLWHLENGSTTHRDLCSLDQSLSTVRQNKRSLITDFNRAVYYNNVQEQLNELSIGYIIEALKRLGINQKINSPFTVTSLLGKGKIPQHVEALLQRCLRILEDKKLLYRAKTSLNNHEPVYLLKTLLPSIKVAKIWRELLHKYPSYLAELTLISHCGKNLPKIVTGVIDPVKAMFPEMNDTPMSLS